MKSKTSAVLGTAAIAIGMVGMFIGAPLVLGAGSGWVLKHYDIASFAAIKGGLATGGAAFLLGVADMACEMRRNNGRASLSPAIFPMAPFWAVLGGVAASSAVSALSQG